MYNLNDGIFISIYISFCNLIKILFLNRRTNKTRKNLKRIASLVIAFALLSMSAFALDGSYDAGTRTFKVTGGETNLQTSLIIVDGAYDELRIDNEEVADAIYINQVAAAENGAAFDGVAIADDGVYTAFFSNESENSVSSVKFTTANIVIDADKDVVAAGEEITLTVSATDSVTDANTKLYVDGVETDTTGTLDAGLVFSIAAEGEAKVQLVSTIDGVTVTSNEITITVEQSGYEFALNAAEVLAPVYNTDAEGNTINGEIVTPAYVNVTLPTGVLNQMKWVLTIPAGDVPSETIQMGGIEVSGDATFAAVFKNGLYVDGAKNDYVEVSGVNAIFQIGEDNYFTNTDHESNFGA